MALKKNEWPTQVNITHEKPQDVLTVKRVSIKSFTFLRQDIYKVLNRELSLLGTKYGIIPETFFLLLLLHLGFSVTMQ